MTKTLLYVVGGIAVVLVAAFIVGSRAGNTPGGQSVLSEQIPSAAAPATTGPASSLGNVPDLSFKDYSGNTVRLADLVGTPLVVNTWASWCPFCREELPDFAAAQKEFGDRVKIVAINRQESLAVAKGYTDAQGTTGKLLFLLDPSDSFYQSIGGFSMPETIFVDKNGNIVDHKRGPMRLEEIRQRIQKIL